MPKYLEMSAAVTIDLSAIFGKGKPKEEDKPKDEKENKDKEE